MNRMCVLLFILLQSSNPAEMPDLPAASGVYYRMGGAKWVSLQPATIEKMNPKGMELFIETGGYTNLGMSMVCRGSKAAMRITASKPIFFVRGVGSSEDAMLIKLSQKKDARSFHTSSTESSVGNKGGFRKGDIRRVVTTKYPDHSYSLTSEEDLSKGEYLLVFGNATTGFDFGIDKKQ
jgi:hypothetical protein